VALGDVVARLAVHLNLDTAAFEKGTGKAKREVTGMERHISSAGKVIAGAFTAMFGAFAIGQIQTMAKEALEYASSLGEVASQLGVTTKELQEYRYAATQSGISQDEMDKGLARLARTIGDAAGGGKASAAIFEKLGISIRDSSGNVRAAGDILPEIADRYVKLGSAAEQSALSAEMFGSKLGQKLNPLLAEGSDGVMKLRNEAAKLGLVLSDDVIHSADLAGDQLITLEQFIRMKFTATVAENAQAIGNLATDLIDLIAAIGSVRDQWLKLQLTMDKIDIWTAPLGTTSLQERLSDSASIDRQIGMITGDTQKKALEAIRRREAGKRDAKRFAPAYGGARHHEGDRLVVIWRHGLVALYPRTGGRIHSHGGFR
jgi:hypothetical protein